MVLGLTVLPLLKVRERESKNPKFSFLQPEDPYYRYYCCLLPNKVSS